MEPSQQICIQTLWRNDGYFIITEGFKRGTKKTNITAYNAFREFVNTLKDSDKLKKLSFIEVCQLSDADIARYMEQFAIFLVHRNGTLFNGSIYAHLNNIPRCINAFYTKTVEECVRNDIVSDKFERH